MAPTDRDLSLLLKVLEKAIPTSLQKTGVARAQKAVAVVVRPEDPNALPIAPQYLKTQFTNISDQWRSDIGNANGRLEQNTLDLPPQASVREVFALGLEKSRVLDPGASFGPHEAWPFIATSLNAPGGGTPGPYWFLIRRTSDHGQLTARLKKASQLSTTVKRNMEEVLHGLEVLAGSAPPLKPTDKFFGKLLAARDAAEQRREGLERVLQRAADQGKPLPEGLGGLVAQVAQGESNLGPALVTLVEAKGLRPETARYWAAVLCEAAYEAADAPGLVMVLATRALDNAHTAARKALRLIDFSEYGPPVETAPSSK